MVYLRTIISTLSFDRTCNKVNETGTRAAAIQRSVGKFKALDGLESRREIYENKTDIR